MQNEARHQIELTRKSGLRVVARAREVDRRLSSLTLRLVFLKWVGLPLLLISVIWVLLVLGAQEVAVTRLLAGVATVGGAGGGLVVALRSVVDEISDLEAERELYNQPLERA